MPKPNQALVFQHNKMATSIINAIEDKPDDEAEWRNVMQLMYHLRQTLACSMCGRFVSSPYSPVQKCHFVCRNCIEGNTQFRLNCDICRDAFQVEDGFKIYTNTNNTASSFALLCQLIRATKMVNKWSNLEICTQNGPITFGQIIQEGSSSENSEDDYSLGDKFRKRVKEREHHCRCGSGAKKQIGRSPGNLTCLGQRCACYKDGKGCVNCKCLGCKNPYGTSSNT